MAVGHTMMGILHILLRGGHNSGESSELQTLLQLYVRLVAVYMLL